MSHRSRANAALPFQSEGGTGGVVATPVADTRDSYAETAVQQQLSGLGTWEQQVETLSPIQTAFDMTGQSGIPGALSQMFQSFASWSLATNDGTARQNVINSAQQVTDAFHQTREVLTQARAQADTQLGGLVDQVNSLAGQIRDYNVQKANSLGDDAGADAGVYSSLEQLSELVPISFLRQANGSISVTLGGQTLLVEGQKQYDLKLDVSVPADPTPTYTSPPPSAMIRDTAGRDITSQVTEGQVGGLLYARNTVLGGLLGDNMQPGDLNRLAAAVAQRTTDILTAGNISDGPPATPGVALFTCDMTDPSTAASTIAVTAAADQLAAIQPATASSGEVSNGVALHLANLGSSSDPLDMLDGLSYSGFYGNMAAKVGTALSKAQNNQATQQDMVTQTRALRQQTSGVSLDEEAINVLQLQRSYEAVAKMVSVLNEMTQTVIGLLST